VAKEFRDGEVVNLGIGIPTLASDFIPEGRSVIFHSESGVIGYGSIADPEMADWDLINAGGEPVTSLPGMCFVDCVEGFNMVRGGHVDTTVLGAYQVSEKGDLANISPGKIPRPTSIGGSMDIAVGAKRTIVAMTHTTKNGEPKIVKECTRPLTAKQCVNLIVTDLAVIEVIKNGLLLREIAPGFTVEEVQAVTEPRLIVSEELKEIEL